MLTVNNIMLWRHGVLPSNNALNSPLFGLGKFLLRCSFIWVKHCSDVLRSLLLPSWLQWKEINVAFWIEIDQLHQDISTYSSSFKSAAANAFTTALMADSSGLLKSSSFCDMMFGFLPILFNLKMDFPKWAFTKCAVVVQCLSSGYMFHWKRPNNKYQPFSCYSFHSFSHQWILI